MSFAHFSIGLLVFFLLICKKFFIKEKSPWSMTWMHIFLPGYFFLTSSWYSLQADFFQIQLVSIFSLVLHLCHRGISHSKIFFNPMGFFLCRNLFWCKMWGVIPTLLFSRCPGNTSIYWINYLFSLWFEMHALSYAKFPCVSKLGIFWLC